MQLTKILLLSLLAAVSALAADATGKWEAVTETPRGEVKMLFNLVADGDSLTGTVGNERMGESEIQDGKVSGDEISFKQVMSRGGRELTIEWKGKVKGDELELTRSFAGMPGGGQGQRPQRKVGGGAPRASASITAKRIP